MKKIKRVAEEMVRQLAGEYPVVAVMGPRQSGKTTLCRMTFPEGAYVNLEEPDERRMAKEDPRGFLSRFDGRVILDEVQHVPDLLSYIQSLVDRQEGMGRFVITGSSNFLLTGQVSQSLAGRVGMLQLLPFCFQELCEATRDTCRQDLFQVLFAGGYPPIYDREADPVRWLNNYIMTYVERDVRLMLSIQNNDAFLMFLGLCAGSVGQLLNMARIANDCGVSLNTVKAWLNLLKESYICCTLQPHHANFRKRLVKTPKLYFYDTGLACRLLRIHAPDQLFAHAMRGALFENWVVMELMKARFNKSLESNLFFWRNSTGLEVDVLFDRGGELLPLEIKSGKTFVPEWCDSVLGWKALAGKAGGAASLVYGGDTSMTWKGVRVFPWHGIADCAALNASTNEPCWHGHIGKSH